jgi:hypothetical protein
LDERSEEHVNMQKWIGGVFDPKGFDLNRVNRDWRGPRRMTGAQSRCMNVFEAADASSSTDEPAKKARCSPGK